VPTVAEFTFDELTPAAFLDRAGYVFRDREAIVDGALRFTYREFNDRSRRLAGALVREGVQRGDRVAALCPNSHVMLELFNGVPMAGAVVVPLNTRLSMDELVYILRHCGARILVATAEFRDQAAQVAAQIPVPLVVAGGDTDDYEAMLAAAEPMALPCVDERGLVAINYTSGTTGKPKGVMHHYRGAYLQALAMAFHARLAPDSRYLWTLPMFHCNGWCFSWAVTAAGGTHLCLRSIDTKEIWRLLREESVTHFSAAPTVLTMIANAPEAGGAPLGQPIHVDAGGAPPSPLLLARLADFGMNVTHVYGLTETFGPLAVNEWQPEWNRLAGPLQAGLKSRQGVANVVADRLRVVDSVGKEVPADGLSIGELVCRGNVVMLGYYKDEEGTDASTIDGWFRTGDLGVVHPDGYVEIRDREKDIIISGGENIASVEVERVLEDHPDVLEAAVVAQPDELWGEVPVAFVLLRPGSTLSEKELVAYVRDRIAHFKAPKRVIFGELSKTATGKIQKAELRRRVATPDSPVVQ
jgi:fatty-acyl-CoA synthase